VKLKDWVLQINKGNLKLRWVMDASLFYMRVWLVEIRVGFKQINLVVM
jgi:hypothetical protein